MSTGRRVGLAALAASAVGGVVAGGVAAQRRAVGRARRRDDPYAAEHLGGRHTEPLTVVADDGLTLHAEVDGDESAGLTIVFVHGFTLSMDCWHFQRRDLADAGRLVFYDQRSHGASGHSKPEHSTIDQLGHDLAAVVEELVPAGPIVLVGHSMGGMTILALADQRPELFGDRIVGVGLMSTAAGAFADTVFGLPGWIGRGLRPLTPSLIKQANRRAATLETGRRAGSDIAFMATRYVSFSPEVPPSLVSFMERMISATSVEVMTEFFDTFLSHDKLKALGVLADLPVLISCGDRDVLTPLAYSRAIAEQLPGAELQVLHDAGHMAILDRHDEVDEALRRLFDRAASRIAATSAG